MADLRCKAFSLLQNVLEGKNPAFQMQDFDKDDDGAFVTMLTLTAFRKMAFIRKILKKLIVKKLSKQNVIAQCALILGSVELLYMQTPDYAVINSYVNLVKSKADKFMAGFVNAVLRKISKNKESFLEEDDGEFFTQEFKSLLRKSYSAKVLAEIEKYAQQQPALDITCINDVAAENLGGCRLPLGTIRVQAKGKINLLPKYDDGVWWVQDFSSSLAVKMLGNINGKKVLELCAAPGGKTAQLLTGGARVVCLDVAEERLNVLRENLQRLKMEPDGIVCEDGLEFLDKTKDKFDVVVLDAPCSATGTLRRHPEIVHLKKESDVKKQVALQKLFLEKVDNVLQKNGALLYCTCSLCKEEGELQIQKFLDEHPQFKIVNLSDKIPTEIKQVVTKEGFVRVLPQHLKKWGGADGFFIACLEKVG